MFERLCPFLKHLVELSDSIAQLVWITLVEKRLPKSLYLRIIHSVDSLSLRRLSFCFLENVVVGKAVIIADENGIVHFRIPGTLTQRQNKSGTTYRGAIEVYAPRDLLIHKGKPIKLNIWNKSLVQRSPQTTTACDCVGVVQNLRHCRRRHRRSQCHTFPGPICN